MRPAVTDWCGYGSDWFGATVNGVRTAVTNVGAAVISLGNISWCGATAHDVEVTVTDVE